MDYPSETNGGCLEQRMRRQLILNIVIMEIIASAQKAINIKSKYFIIS